MTSHPLGDFTAVDILAHGRFGDVVRARHPAEARDVALVLVDVPPSAPPDLDARFVAVMQSVAAIRHPALLAIEDVGVADGQPYLVTELVDGGTLADRLGTLRERGAGMPVEEALGVVRQIGAGLDAAHAAGIVHGDVTPASVFHRPTGEWVLADLGLGPLLRPDGDTADRAADRRALARLFLELTRAPAGERGAGPGLAGARPAPAGAGDRPAGDGAVPSGAELPPAVRAVLATALDPDPDGGFETAGALAEALAAARSAAPAAASAATEATTPTAARGAAHGSSAPAPATPGAAARRGSPGRLAVAVAAMALVAMGGIAVVVLGGLGPRPQPSTAASPGGSGESATPGAASPSTAPSASAAATASGSPALASLRSCPATTGSAVLGDAFSNPTIAVVEAGGTFATSAMPEPLAARYAVEARVSASAAPESAAYGITFGGLGDADRFELLVRGTDEFRLVRRAGGEVSDLVPWTATDRLDTSGQSWIGVVVRGSDVTACINGSIVAALEEPALRPGRAGMTVEAVGGPVEIRFEDFTVLGLP